LEEIESWNLFDLTKLDEPIRDALPDRASTRDLPPRVPVALGQKLMNEFRFTIGAALTVAICTSF